MTVENSNNKTVLVANGIIFSFAFTFKVFAASEIAVYVDDTLIVSGYTVTGLNSDSGGNVVFDNPPADQSEVTMIRDIDYTQEADFVVASAFNPETLERQLDRQTMMIQRLQEEVSRAVSVSIGSESGATIDPLVVEVVADNIDSVNAVASNIDNVNSVADNEQNIQTIVDEIATLQDAINVITLKNVDLSLTLNNDPEVIGVNYNTVQAAYDYALTVLQVGGHLTLNIPKNTTITEPGIVDIDLNRVRLSVVGVNPSSSIIEFTASSVSTGSNNFTHASFEGPSQLSFTNVIMRASGLVASGSPAAFSIRYAPYVLSNATFEKTTGDLGQGLAISDSSGIIGGGLFSGPSVGLNISRGTVTASSLNISATSSPFSFIGLNCTGTVSATSYAIDASLNTGTSTGIRTSGAGIVLLSSTTTITSADTNFDPPVDTYGNGYSRIVSSI